MTTPVPPPTTPLLTKDRLAVWTQERPLADPQFADLVIDSVSVLLRHYGDPYWELATLPARARDIAYFVARNYYLNPDLARQESTGPIQTTLDNKVLQGIEFDETQIFTIRNLVTATEGNPVEGLWALSTTRGPLETGRRTNNPNVVIWDTRGGWPIEYLHGDDAGAFGIDEV